jgi:peptide/nickel transport system permease protein
MFLLLSDLTHLLETTLPGDKSSVRKLGKHVARFLMVLGLGGFLSATLVRVAPEFGVDEEELDSRLNQESMQALRQTQAETGNLPEFYAHYLFRVLHGDLGASQIFHQPVRQLLAERFPETLESVGLGLALGWTSGLALAMVTVMSRSLFVDLVALLVSILRQSRRL